MSAIHAVLLVPEEGDPLGLLKGGPCGSRPPKAWLHEGIWRHGHASSNDNFPRALAIAWSGVLWQARPWLERAAIRAKCERRHSIRDLLDEVVFLGEGVGALVEALYELGTVVILDANGKEVTP